jgi:hypothetical protein
MGKYLDKVVALSTVRSHVRHQGGKVVRVKTYTNSIRKSALMKQAVKNPTPTRVRVGDGKIVSVEAEQKAFDEKRAAHIRAVGRDRIATQLRSEGTSEAEIKKDLDFHDKITGYTPKSESQVNVAAAPKPKTPGQNLASAQAQIRAIKKKRAKAAAPPARPIHEIADEISKSWGSKVNYGAKPYLDAMRQLSSMDDKYYADDARSILSYFVSNAASWHGEDAKRIKAELRAMLKGAK